MIFEGDWALVELSIGIRGRPVTCDDGVTAEVFVGEAELVHVALEGQRIHLGGCVEAEGAGPIPRRVGVGLHGLAEAVGRAFVKSSVHEYRIGLTAFDGGGRELHGGTGAPAATASTCAEAKHGDTDCADEGEFVIGVH